TGLGDWRVFAPADLPLAARLRQQLPDCAGHGVVLCLRPGPDEGDAGFLLEAAHAALTEEAMSYFVLVQQGGGAASLAKTLHLEAPAITACVVDLPLDHPQASEWIMREIGAASGYVEARYDAKGKRRQPVLALLPMPEQPAPLALSADDVILVTGGGKGIAAEAALALARETDARLALIGRSEVAADAELA